MVKAARKFTLDEYLAYNDGEELNANSPKQLREVLFDKLALPIKKRPLLTKLLVFWKIN